MYIFSHYKFKKNYFFISLFLSFFFSLPYLFFFLLTLSLTSDHHLFFLSQQPTAPPLPTPPLATHDITNFPFSPLLLYRLSFHREPYLRYLWPRFATCSTSTGQPPPLHHQPPICMSFLWPAAPHFNLSKFYRFGKKFIISFFILG